MPLRSIVSRISIICLIGFNFPTFLSGQCEDQSPVKFTIEKGVANNGDEVCVDVTIENFVDIKSFLIPFSFDPTVLQYNRCEPNPTFVYDCEGSNPPNKLAAGIIQLFWNFTGAAPAQTLPDGEIFITFCFDVIGVVGDNTSIITGSVPPLGGAPGVDAEIFRGDCSDPLPLDENEDGMIAVGCVSPDVAPNICPTEGNANSGSVRFSVCGGTAPYDYDLDGNFAGRVENDLEEVLIEGLAPGDYTLNIVDADGVRLIFSDNTFTILSGEPLSITGIDQRGPSCENVTNLNGFISVATTGGTGDISYKWSSTAVNVNPLMNINVGNYSVTVSDENGCRDVRDDIIVDYNRMSIDVSTNDAACDNSFGTVSVTALGGDPRIRNGLPEYRYYVNDDPGRNMDILFLSNVPPNVPTRIRVEDFSVSNPTCMIDTIVTLTSTKSIGVNVSASSSGCGAGGGNITGSTVANTGALGPTITYVVLDDAGQEVQSQSIPSADQVQFIGLIPGDYTLVATDDLDGCSNVSIPVTIIPGLGNGLNVDNLSTEPSCDGVGLGSIEILVSGGDGNYMFEWADDASINSDFRDQLEGGEYSVIVTDGAGCSGTEVVTISTGGQEISLLDPDARVVVQPPSCGGADDGAITIQVFNPANATFSWSDGSNVSSRSELGPGEYFVTIAATGFCPKDTSFVIQEAAGIDAEIAQDEIRCEGESVNLSVIDNSGNGGLDFNWSDNLGSNQLAIGVTPGDYSVIVTNTVTGCDTMLSYTVMQHPELLVDVSNIVANDCFGGNTGSATGLASGGAIQNGTYFYTWSSGETNATASALSAGMQWVIASDGQCGGDTTFFEVDEPALIQLNEAATQIIAPRCFGDSNGSISALAVGGSGNYTGFAWSSITRGTPIGNNSAIANLSADSLLVLIVDDRGCSGLDTIVIEEPSLLEATIDSFGTVGLSCNGTATGIVKVLSNGGNEGVFNYSWTPNVSASNTATGLSEGMYDIIVSDVNGCTSSTSFMMEAPQPVEVDLENEESVTCNGDRVCIGNFSPTGGTGSGYRFALNNGSLTPVDTCITVFAGQYTVTIYDQDGCSTVETINVIEPEEIVVELGPDRTIDIGTSTQLRAEYSSPEQISQVIWSPVENLDCIDCPVLDVMPEVDTEYNVIVRDINGCSDEDEVMIRVRQNRNVYIPNVIRPDKSNQNAKFKIFSGRGVSVIEDLVIFDRWGNQVHTVENIEGMATGAGDWDGRHNGKFVEPGVYAYVANVVFTDGEKIQYKGSITVLR